MTYLYFRDAESAKWTVVAVTVNGDSQVIETFDSAPRARAYTVGLRNHAAMQMEQSGQSSVQMQ